MKKLFLIIFLITQADFLSAQDNNDLFFTEQLREYKKWLDITKLSTNLNIDTCSYIYKQDTLTIFLKSNYFSLDSLISSWDSLDNLLTKNNQVSAGELLHNQATFLFDLFPKNLKIIVQRQNKEYYREIFFNNTVEEKSLKIMSNDPIKITIQNLKLPNNSKILKQSGNKLVNVIRQELERQIKLYYASKSSWLYSVNIDTLRTYFNSINYRITCLKSEILDESYFEFIELSIEIAEQNNNYIEIRTNIKGKYCGGLRCPKQREKFYYLMEERYANKLSEYSAKMENKILNWLSN